MSTPTPVGQEFVDTFVADLETFATGSYLAEQERDNWTQPFDPAAVAQVKDILQRYLASINMAPRPINLGLAQTAVRATLDELEELNEKFFGAVIEPEEEQQLTEFFRDTARAVGLEDEELDQLPGFEQPASADDFHIDFLD